LVDILAGHKSVGKLRGQILVNGYPITKEFKERAGYVAAETVHIATLTVWETLCFTANIRLPTSMSKQDKLNYVSLCPSPLSLVRHPFIAKF
jgi:ATP-binding cassette subfamily G (WHITE) protein 2